VQDDGIERLWRKRNSARISTYRSDWNGHERQRALKDNDLPHLRCEVGRDRQLSLCQIEHRPIGSR
jgi:hypothetical protein